MKKFWTWKLARVLHVIKLFLTLQKTRKTVIQRDPLHLILETFYFKSQSTFLILKPHENF